MTDVHLAPSNAVQHTDQPIPLSFPALLRNPRISTRFAHLQGLDDSDRPRPISSVKRTGRDDKEGKRWIRRSDNARFVGNPHVVHASGIDHVPPRPTIRPTFPEPLPSYLSRNTKLPSIKLPIRDPVTANAGRFSLSLKGMRRTLRRYGLRAQLLVRDIETEITTWLREGGTIVSPDSAEKREFNTPGKLIGEVACIREVSRTPLQLVWSIGDDGFARYVVHCCARYHEIVSYSKDTSGTRLTYLLRPNTVRPNFLAPANLCTPPVTDLEYSSHADSESDLLSSDLAESDTELIHSAYLSAISEDPASSPVQQNMPQPPPSEPLEGEAWSIIGDDDADGYETGSDGELADSVASLSLDRQPDIMISHNVRQSSHIHVWDRQRSRSGSSPSRSPVRRSRPRRRAGVCVEPPRSIRSRKSFYDYLYF